MQTLQTANDLKKFKRQQAFIVKENSTVGAYEKGVCVTVMGQQGYMSEFAQLIPLRSNKAKLVKSCVDGLGDLVSNLVPFTIGMLVKPQEGWKVIKQ